MGAFRGDLGTFRGGLGTLLRRELGDIGYGGEVAVPRVSLGFHLGYKQERIKQKKMKSKETVKTGSKEAEEQEVEQQKHMTEEKKK